MNGKLIPIVVVTCSAIACTMAGYLFGKDRGIHEVLAGLLCKEEPDKKRMTYIDYTSNRRWIVERTDKPNVFKRYSEKIEP